MLWDIGVSLEFRRRGIATKLLNEGIEHGRRLGMKRLEAWNFYDRFGFEKFYEYYHVLISNRENLRAFDRDGLHVVEIYAHVMPETDLEEVKRKYQPKEVLTCRGYELLL